MNEILIKELFLLVPVVTFVMAGVFYVTMTGIRLARLSAVGFIASSSALMAVDEGAIYGFLIFTGLVLVPIFIPPIMYLVMILVKGRAGKTHGKTGIIIPFDWLSAYKEL